MASARTLAMACALLGAGGLFAATPPPKPGKVMIYKDWAVGCDNTLDCEAVSFMPDDFPGEGLMLSFERAAGNDGTIKLSVWGFSKSPDRYQLMIDGRTVNSGEIARGVDSFELNGEVATKVAHALATGNMLRLVDGMGTEIGKLSLAGSAAALRHIDSMQGRAGSNGAIVARGKKKATAKIVTPPVIAVPKITPNSVLPDAAAMVKLSATSPCAEARTGSTEDIAYSLGLKDGLARSLVMLNCGAGAYNFSTAPYVGTRDSSGRWDFAPARFDYDNDWGIESGDAIQLMVNSDWDPETQTLSSYAKSRGVGDCGSAEQYVWDGDMFRLISATRMDECRGSVGWIRVWRADVTLNG